MDLKKMHRTILSFFTQRPAVLISYILITVVVSIFQYYSNKQFENTSYTPYNNYIIFKQSFYHLAEQKDLYIAYPEEHWDLYKYSPTFAFSMAALAYLPDLAALTIWNLINSMVLFFALSRIKLMDDKKKNLLLWVVLPELIINLQNLQSNGITAGLMIFTYNFLEEKKTSLAALTAVLGFFIKIYGAAALLIFIFYPRKKQFIIASLISFLVLLLIPLIIVSPEQLIFLYKSWLNILQYDANTSTGLSVIGWLQTWFGIEPDKIVVLATGLIILGIPLLKTKLFTEQNFRLTYFAALMVWIIIFNHKSESPTFIIAMAGAAIWYFNSSMNKIYTGLFLLAFILSSLSPTDIFPAFIRNKYVIPYVLKAIPFIILWLVMIAELVFRKESAKPAIVN